MKRRFVQVDVFAEQKLYGNPLAVVVDAEGLTSEEMQAFAKWTNLSETTFLLPPTDSKADYYVRIFTPQQELPFAGHPTLGSAHAWLQHGGIPQYDQTIVQECGVGLVEVQRNNNLLSFAAPPLIKSGPLDADLLSEAIDALGIARTSVLDSAWIDNGPGWIGLLLNSAEEVLAISPKPMNLKIGVAGFHKSESPFAYEVRAFFSSNGVTFEDPVTGSLNASLAQWLTSTGRVTAPFIASQGGAIGYQGIVHVSLDDSQEIWIGGNVTTCISGTVDI